MFINTDWNHSGIQSKQVQIWHWTNSSCWMPTSWLWSKQPINQICTQQRAGTTWDRMGWLSQFCSSCARLTLNLKQSKWCILRKQHMYSSHQIEMPYSVLYIHNQHHKVLLQLTLVRRYGSSRKPAHSITSLPICISLIRHYELIEDCHQQHTTPT